MHWVKYHEHTSVLPSNFIAAGDSWLRLDPLLGQGMSKAMAEAITLDAVLRRVRPSLSTVPAIAPAYFKKISARMAGVWMGGKLGDYEFEACEPVAGESRDIEPVMRAVRMAAVKRMLRGDQDLQRRMSGVNAWVLPPTDLLAPSVLVRLAMDWALGR
jgi:2-polyprenyl-6-methoxyphenol hydroxylase-like FAD-dependent oxidoreductase